MSRAGVFIKTSSPHIVEVLGESGLDFAILDAEHSPFDRAGLDLMVLAGRAAGLPLYIRVPEDNPATILQALDLGPRGLVVPHVDTPEQASAVVRRARFEGGERGYSNSGRFGRYGATTLAEAIRIGDGAEIICQIESPEGVANAEAIAEVPGVAGLLVGRADLALAMGLRSIDAEPVTRAARASLAAARRNGKIAAIVIAAAEEVPPWRDAGANLFVFGSEQALLRNAASQLARRAAELFAAPAAELTEARS